MFPDKLLGNQLDCGESKLQDSEEGIFMRMTPRLLVVSWLFLIVITMSGCTNCGWIWEDWIGSPHKSCHSD